MSHTAAMLAALGLPAVSVEPEVLRADLNRIQEKSLASILAALVNDNEPLLKADVTGNVITVSERGGQATFTFTVKASSRDGGGEPKAAPDDQQ
jgi:hypothetical protein